MARNFAPRSTRKRKSSMSYSAQIKVPHFDECIERFSDSLSDVVTSIAEQKERLNSHDNLSNRIQEDIRELRKSQSDDTHVLNSRIDTVQRELTEKLETQTEHLTAHFDTGVATLTEGRQKDIKRLASLEKWRWIIGGGAAVLSATVVDVLVRIFYQPIAQMVLKFYASK